MLEYPHPDIRGFVPGILVVGEFSPHIRLVPGGQVLWVGGQLVALVAQGREHAAGLQL